MKFNSTGIKEYTFDRLSRVIEVLTDNHLSEAVFNALVDARMRVPLDEENWVRALIGKDRAAKCTSLRKRVR